MYICGVPAAIATCGAIKGDSKKLSFVISIVLIIAIPMMYLMPYLAKLLGLSLRETLFSIAFVSIGLETDFKRIFNKDNKSYIYTFLIAQTFNILLTLVVAYLLFGNYAYFN